MKIFLSLLIILCSIPPRLHPVLDGLINPIQLDTTYSFTNKEFARGLVKFNKGFDVAINGTTYVGVNQRISGNINLNNGVLHLLSDLYVGPDTHIKGTGSINLNNKTIYFTGRFYLEGWIKLVGATLTMDGNNTGTLIIESSSKIDAQAQSTIIINKAKLIMEKPSQTFLINTVVIQTFTLTDVDWKILSGGSFSWNPNIFTIFGNCSFTGVDSTFTTSNKTTINGSASLSIGEGTIFKTPALRIDQADAQLILNNKSRLVFTNTSTMTWDGFGFLKVNGKASMSATKPVLTGVSNGIQFASGSRLFLDNIYFKIA